MDENIGASTMWGMLKELGSRYVSFLTYFVGFSSSPAAPGCIPAANVACLVKLDRWCPVSCGG